MLTSQNTTSTMGEVAVVAMSEFESSYPTTEAQLEVWLSSTQSVEANCAYNEIATLQFRGPLDRQRLESAIENLVQRHAALRMTFSEDGQTTYVRKGNRFGFRWLETEATGSSSREEQHRQVIQEEAQKPFDLQQGPLFRVVGQSFSDSDHSVTITAHHAVLDGWSLALVCRDLGAFYDAAAGKAGLPPAGSYQEYSKSMQEYFLSPEGQRDEAFWVERFSDQIPVLDLPIEHSRPSLRTYRAARHDHQLSIDLVERLRRVGAKSGCSLFNTVLAAFQAFVGRISGNDDFCIGIPTAGQSAMNQHELVGHCVNTLPLRTQFDPSMTFREYLTRSRGELLDAMDHQRYSFGQLLRKLAPPRDPSRPPMVSISFNLDPEINASELGFAGLDVRVQVEPRAFENFEWFVNGVIMEDKSVELQVQYNSDLFTAESIGYYMEGFAAFLNAVTVDPDQPVAKIHAMSVNQRRAQLVDWNQTSMPYPQGCTLHQEFSRQAAETPDRVAVEFGESVLTFKQIEERSNQVARYLQSQGVQCGDLVGICIERSERMLVYLMGILKSGAGYVPLDPAYPQDRLQYMCEHSKLKVIVTESTAMDVVKTLGKPSLDLDQSKDEVARQESSPVASDVGPANTCYVIYTSGSTGKPKGVVVPHDPVVNFLYSMKQTPGFGADDVVLAVTTLSFDIAVLELYLPLITGGKVVIADQLTAADGGQLVDKIQASGITLLQATPATWRMLIQSGWEGQANLKVLCGGEPMPTDLVGPLLDRCDELWNMYGPTETTVWSAAFQITDAEAPIMIGRPIGNTQIYLLDANGCEVPTGCEGEVFIGGAGVTHGYLHRDDLTEERFVENRYFNPFNSYVNHRLYRTGDLARLRFDGNLQFLRRNDKQVKVRGFRIELGEIEKTLESFPAIRQNVVIVREDTPGDARLVAYFVSEPGQDVDVRQLREHVRRSVPYYMVPQHFVSMDKMPQTNNGKIDYKALPAPTENSEPKAADKSTASSETGAQGDAPSETAGTLTPAESYLTEVWERVLEIQDVDVADNFFEVGGHSLLVVKVISEVKDKTGVRLSPQDFLIGNLEMLADQICEAPCFASETESASAAPEAKASEQASVPTTGPAADSEQSPKSFVKSLKGFWD